MKTCPNCGEIVGDNVASCFACHYHFGLKKVVTNEEKKAYEEQHPPVKVEPLKGDEFFELKEQITAFQKNEKCILCLSGCRGRRIHVYDNRVTIITDVTLGSVLTNNATDGEKTIFYKDVIGIQFKKPGITVGYLQLETASGQMNNITSNAFSENTFTFEELSEDITLMKDYIVMQVAKFKK